MKANKQKHNMKQFIALFLSAICFLSCKKEIDTTPPLKKALNSTSPNIKRVIDSLEQHEVQIKFTQIDRKNDSIVFTDYSFQSDSNNYFYPASSVKLPVAILALEKLNSIQNFDRNTTFYVEGDTIETTMAIEIAKIFAISDNKAYNRLFEFLGQDEINTRLKNKGIENVRISHRIATLNADEITTKPLIFYLNDSTTTYLKKIINTPLQSLKLNQIKKGDAHIDEDDELLNEPFDFSLKNYYSINAQHQVLKRILFPEKFSNQERFNITEKQREFILNAIQSLPKDLGYTSDEYYDSYAKFFMFGDSKKPIPANIKIYNKIGYAYGTLTDCAYIKDIDNNIEFLLTATILVNKNHTFNDDNYEYDVVGIPFMAELGRELYTSELERKK